MGREDKELMNSIDIGETQVEVSGWSVKQGIEGYRGVGSKERYVWKKIKGHGRM